MLYYNAIASAKAKLNQHLKSHSQSLSLGSNRFYIYATKSLSESSKKVPNAETKACTSHLFLDLKRLTKVPFFA